MSSILKALKKVEKTAPQQDESEPWTRKIDQRRALNSRVKKTWLVNRFFTALVILALVLVAAWLIFNQRHAIVAKLSGPKAAPSGTSASGTPPPAYHAKINNPAVVPLKTPRKESPLPANSSRPSSLKKNAGPSDLKRRAASAPAATIPGPPQKSAKKSILQKSAPLSAAKMSPAAVHATPSSTSEKQPEKPGAMSSKKRKGPAASDNFSALQRINDPNVKLQAIAWSKDAARRLAVINNRIVREGEAIDGFSVIKIREEDIVVNDGTRSWRLEFGLQQ